MEEILQILRSTVEWREWGWNALTIGVIGTAIFALIQGFGLWKQNQRIWRDGKVPTLSPSFFLFSMCFFFAFLTYGIQGRSIAMVFAGTLGFIHVPIFMGIVKFKEVNRRERKLLLLIPLMIPLMGIAGWLGFREALLIAYFGGIVIALGRQVREAWRSPNPKDLDPAFIVSFLLSAAFWSVYGWRIGDLPLLIANPLLFILWITLLTIWWKKGRRRAVAVPQGVRAYDVSREQLFKVAEECDESWNVMRPLLLVLVGTVIAFGVVLAVILALVGAW